MRFASLAKRPLVAALALTVLLAAGVFVWSVTLGAETVAHMGRQRAIEGCKAAKAGAPQTECIFEVLTTEIKARGVGATMEAFTLAYETFPEFVSGGCHRQAHRVGDLAYYNLYIGSEDLERIDLPQSTTACGYGFYHGFLEHLIQDQPRPEFVDEVCAYLTNRLGETMGDIRITCYHGAGHGFALAHRETLGQPDWGNFKAFTEGPAQRCREMPEAESADVQQCLEGIYNVIVDTMELGEYGFAYDYERPFRQCDTAIPADWAACYYEMAQKLDRASGLDPVKLSALADQGKRKDLQDMAFRVGIAGVVQQVIVQENGFASVLARCTELPQGRFNDCLKSVINGLYEHGSPQEEYKKALSACTQESVAYRNAESLCYETVALRLPRFYGNERIAQICPEFPQEHRGLCESMMEDREQHEPVRPVQAQ